MKEAEKMYGFWSTKVSFKNISIENMVRRFSKQIIIFIRDRTVIFISPLFSSNINNTRSGLSVLSIKSTGNYLNIFNSVSRKLKPHTSTSQRILYRYSIQQVCIFVRSTATNMDFIIGDNNTGLLVKNVCYI